MEFTHSNINKDTLYQITQLQYFDINCTLLDCLATNQDLSKKLKTKIVFTPKELLTAPPKAMRGLFPREDFETLVRNAKFGNFILFFYPDLLSVLLSNDVAPTKST